MQPGSGQSHREWLPAYADAHPSTDANARAHTHTAIDANAAAEPLRDSDSDAEANSNHDSDTDSDTEAHRNTDPSACAEPDPERHPDPVGQSHPNTDTAAIGLTDSQVDAWRRHAPRPDPDAGRRVRIANTAGCQRDPGRLADRWVPAWRHGPKSVRPERTCAKRFHRWLRWDR